MTIHAKTAASTETATPAKTLFPSVTSLVLSSMKSAMNKSQWMADQIRKWMNCMASVRFGNPLIIGSACSFIITARSVVLTETASATELSSAEMKYMPDMTGTVSLVSRNDMSNGIAPNQSACMPACSKADRGFGMDAPSIRAKKYAHGKTTIAAPAAACRMGDSPRRHATAAQINAPTGAHATPHSNATGVINIAYIDHQ